MNEFSGPGLYLHIPFCSSICPYCDFSVLTGDRVWQQRYLQHLLLEIALLPESGWPALISEPPQQPYDTIYLGGGTPSKLPPGDLERILGELRDKLPIHDNAWLFLEVNPEDVTGESVERWRQMGVRTISLGVQSFSERNLAFLGRRHSPRTASRSLERVLSGGFDTVSIDLIYGLPDQTPSNWLRDLDEAVAAGIHHLSCYQLTLHPHTPFGFRQQRGKLTEMPSDQQADLFLLTHRRLEEGGLPGYEVSNFAAAAEHRSSHNRKYWSHTPYLGLGPSAHSFAQDRRWWNARKIKAWMAPLAAGSLPIENSEELPIHTLVLERLMLGFRTYAGVDFDTLPAGTGAELWQVNETTIGRLVDAELATVEGTCLRPTLRGLAIADTLARAFDLGRLEHQAGARMSQDLNNSSNPEPRGLPMQGSVTVVEHPLIQHKLTLMRMKETSTASFRALLSEISILLAYEVTRDLPLTLHEIETPLARMKAPLLDGKKIVLVGVLRAGLGLLDGMLHILPSARVGHIGLSRDESTLKPSEYYFKLPADLHERDVLIVDPMLATGNTAVAAVDRIQLQEPRTLKLVSLLSAPEGIANFHRHHPEVPIVTAAIDEKLDERAYIVPGLGDAGDRMFGTR